jgi:tol-pal system protein YbgF
MAWRSFVVVGTLVVLVGCAGTGSQPRDLQADARLDRLAQAQQRLEMRIDEVTRNLLSLRERVETQAAAVTELEEKAKAQPPMEMPPLGVVRVEPLQEQEPSPGPAATAPPQGKPSVSDPAAELYRKAFNSFREGRFGPAILDFEEFLRRYPGHAYADNAQYWIGEAYYSQGEYQQAVVEFGKVVERYPRGGRAADALLKIGLCYERVGDPDKARVFWRRLVDQYPGSEAARQVNQLTNR